MMNTSIWRSARMDSFESNLTSSVIMEPPSDPMRKAYLSSIPSTLNTCPISPPVNLMSDWTNPWELGQGWSREEVEKTGKDKVYFAISTAFKKTGGKAWQADAVLGRCIARKNRRMQSSSAPPHPQSSGGTNQPIPLTNRHGRLRNADCPFAWPREWRHGGAFVAVGQRPGKT